MKTPGLLVDRLFIDSKERIWAGTSTGLKLLFIDRFATNKIQFQKLPEAFTIPVLQQDHISDILEDRDRNLWVATDNGLVKISPAGSHQIFTTKEGLPSNIITRLFQDRQKNIWIGTVLGITKFSVRNLIQTFTNQNGAFETETTNIHCFTNNNLLIGGDEGIQFTDSKQTRFKTIFKNDNNSTFLGFSGNSIIYTIRNENHPQAVIADVKEDGQILSRYKVFANNLVFCIEKDKDNNVFIGTESGVLVFREGRLLTTWLSSYRITTLLPDNGFLWAGTRQNGLYKISYDKKNISHSQIIELNDYLPDKHVRSLFKDKEQNVWIGTRYKGAIKLQTNQIDPAKYTITIFDSKMGLIIRFCKMFCRRQLIVLPFYFKPYILRIRMLAYYFQISGNMKMIF
jgi:ligand-binding sensor domain-containing protein